MDQNRMGEKLRELFEELAAPNPKADMCIDLFNTEVCQIEWQAVAESVLSGDTASAGYDWTRPVTMLAIDMIRNALSRVDWLEVAAHYREE